MLTHSRQRFAGGFGTLAIMRNISVIRWVDLQRQAMSFVAFVFAYQAHEDRIYVVIFAFAHRFFFTFPLGAVVAPIHVLSDRMGVVREAECARASVLDLPGDVNQHIIDLELVLVKLQKTLHRLKLAVQNEYV